MLDTLLKLLHPVMPFVTETLWKALTGGESLVIAQWPTASGFALEPVAAQRIADVQKLVTEIRRFRSDQGLADRQKVPARLAGIDAGRPGRARGAGDGAGLADQPGADFSPTAHVEVRLSGGTVDVELDTSGTVDVGGRAAPAGEGPGRRAEGTGRHRSQTRQRGVPGQGARRRRRQDPRPPEAGPRGGRPDHRAPGCAGMSAEPLRRADVHAAEPTPDEIAALLQVEHLLDQRWPETKMEPSTIRIEALMELLGSPQHSYPCIHIAGTNGKTSVARMIDALLTAFGRRTGRTTSPHLQSAIERIAIDNQPISPARYVEIYREIEPFVQMVDAQSLGRRAGPRRPGDEQVRGAHRHGVRGLRRRTRRRRRRRGRAWADAGTPPTSSTRPSR